MGFPTTHSSAVDLKVLAGHQLLVGPGEGMWFQVQVNFRNSWQVHIEELQTQETMRKLISEHGQEF